MSNLIAALQQLEIHPGLHHLLNLDKLNQYSHLIVHIKADILLPQPLDESPHTPLKILSPSIVQFMAGALSLTPKDVQTSWDILGTYLWHCRVVPLIQEDFDAFKSFRWELGLSGFLTFILYILIFKRHVCIKLESLFIRLLYWVWSSVAMRVVATEI